MFLDLPLAPGRARTDYYESHATRRVEVTVPRPARRPDANYASGTYAGQHARRFFTSLLQISVPAADESDSSKTLYENMAGQFNTFDRPNWKASHDHRLQRTRHRTDPQTRPD
jgi:hypothetical protein